MREDKAVLYWEETCEPTEISPGRVVTRMKRPILEFVFDKSKVNDGFDGNIYYEFHQSSGQLLESSAMHQETYAKRSAVQQDKRPAQEREGESVRSTSRTGAQFVRTKKVGNLPQCK
jgi:hypothetical protein